jgi:hypothetical protein
VGCLMKVSPRVHELANTLLLFSVAVLLFELNKFVD